jgi:hypothetical protein
VEQHLRGPKARFDPSTGAEQLSHWQWMPTRNLKLWAPTWTVGGTAVAGSSRGRSAHVAPAHAADREEPEPTPIVETAPAASASAMQTENAGHYDVRHAASRRWPPFLHFRLTDTCLHVPQWVIPDFTRLSTEKMMSETFEIGTYLWCGPGHATTVAQPTSASIAVHSPHGHRPEIPR